MVSILRLESDGLHSQTGLTLGFWSKPIETLLHCNNTIIKENNPAASILHSVSDTQGDTLYPYF